MFDKLKAENNIRPDLYQAIQDQDKKILSLYRGPAFNADQYLSDNEVVQAVCGGKYDGKPAILVMTDKRVVAIWASLGAMSFGSAGAKLENINQVNADQKLTGTTVVVKGSGIDVELKKALNGPAFAQAVTSATI